MKSPSGNVPEAGDRFARRVLVLLAFCLLALTARAQTAAFTVGPDTLPAATSGVAYSVQLTATGATLPCTWSTLSLPPGLSIDSTTGLVSGTPGAAGNYVLYVKVVDAQNATVQKPWNFKINSGGSGGGSGGGGGGSGGGGTTTFTVTVVNGTLTGGATTGQFNQNDVVTVTANPPPPGQWLKSWAGTVSFADNLATTTTFAVPYGGATVTAVFHTPPTLVQPVGGHPRIWLNQSDLPTLRSWAVPGNLLYQNGLRVALSTALSAHSKCFPNGQPAVPYPDMGDIYGYDGARVSATLVSEHHELVLAFCALVDPNPANRLSYALKAREMLMFQMNESVKGHAAGVAFRDAFFILYNRPHTVGESWPLIVDWLQGVTDANGQVVEILSPQDKLTIRNVFMLWANDCLNAYISGGDHPSPIGTTNSTALLPNGRAHRVAANNYYACHARLVTMMPMALDAADDPPLNPAAPEGSLGNTLRSYLPNATGAWLYQQFAIYGDPAQVRAAYALPATADVGNSSGGLPVEGGLYGHSYGYVLGQMLALQTTGFADTALSGPQATLVAAPVWDRFAEGLICQMVNNAAVPAAQPYLGPVFQMASFGDLLRLYMTEDLMQPYALLALIGQKRGDSKHLNTARWFATHAMPGGQTTLISRAAQPWNTAESILYFLLFDPNAAPPTDPRPAFTKDFLDTPQARLLVRSGWTANDTLFTYRAAPQSINHANCDAGQFEFWRKGEWLTKEHSNYDDYGVGQCSAWHNTLCLLNWCSAGTPTLGFPEPVYFAAGSSYNNGSSAGDPSSRIARQKSYAHVQSDLTKLYNRPSVFNAPNALIDISYASRSALHLKNDFIVVYDRAESLHSNLFKRFNLCLTAVPAVSDGADGFKVSTATTPNAQRLFVTTVLPAAPSIQWFVAGGAVTHPAELEPTIGRIQVESASPPLVERFLHVLQGADPGSPRATCTLLQNSAGDRVQGVAFSDQAAVFAYDPRQTFTATSYDTPAAALFHHVSGLPPLSTFHVGSQTLADGSRRFTVTPGGAFITDSSGVLAFVNSPAGPLNLVETTLNEFLSAYFGSAANLQGGGLPGDDPDGDGQTNQAEYLAGTSPLDSTSYFSPQITSAGDGVHLSFQALPNKSYTIQFKSELTDSAWLRHADVAASLSGQWIDIVLPGAPTGRAFYRIATPQVP